MLQIRAIFFLLVSWLNIYKHRSTPQEMHSSETINKNKRILNREAHRGNIPSIRNVLMLLFCAYKLLNKKNKIRVSLVKARVSGVCSLEGLRRGSPGGE